jgi:hypothetical protein
LLDNTTTAQPLVRPYLVRFSPAVMDGKAHQLEVRIKRPGANVLAPKTYRAAGPPVDAERQPCLEADQWASAAIAMLKTPRSPTAREASVTGAGRGRRIPRRRTAE